MNWVENNQISVKDLSRLPLKPGVYLFKNEDSDILYVGKAKILKNRIKQYFHKEGDRRPFSLVLQQQAAFVSFISVASEQEALILENELIKKYKPKYNILLKDDRRYLSLRLDLKHEWPRVEIVRKIKKDHAIYFGPFSSSLKLRETLEFIQSTFPLRSCNDHKLYNRSRPCLEYEMKRCVAPCVGYVQKQDYKVILDDVVLFLRGKRIDLLQRLKDEMMKAADLELYEKAKFLRDKIISIEESLSRSPVVSTENTRKRAHQDAIGISSLAGKQMITILFIRHQMVWDKRSFYFEKTNLDEETLLTQFIERYYSSEVFLPDEIIIPISIETPELGPQGPEWVTPRSEDRKRWSELAQQNAKDELVSREGKLSLMTETLEHLKSKLNLKYFPETMDAVDISHHQGQETVASVVRFKNGLPDKNYYRKLNLKIQQVDDFASMKEAISRRYKSPEDLPKLLVVDGGKGQLDSVLSIFNERKWTDYLDIVSLAKARDGEIRDPLNPRNRERVFFPKRKNPLLLVKGSAEENLLAYLRDEAHRFAITHHRNRKVKSLEASWLDSIPGMNEKTKLKILRAFGSVETLMQAEEAELKKVLKNPLFSAVRNAVLQSKQNLQ